MKSVVLLFSIVAAAADIADAVSSVSMYTFPVSSVILAVCLRRKIKQEERHESR